MLGLLQVDYVSHHKRIGRDTYGLAAAQNSHGLQVTLRGPSLRARQHGLCRASTVLPVLLHARGGLAKAKALSRIDTKALTQLARRQEVGRAQGGLVRL